MSIRIEAVGVQQADEVYRIMQLAFEQYRDRLTPPSGALVEIVEDVRLAIESGGAWLAFDGDQAVGCARYRFFPEYAYVGRLAVLPEYRGKGIATALMQTFETLAKQAGMAEARLGVRACLAENLRFYENLGYRALSARAYPEGGDVGITLNKRL
jgi:GNAT superfamily N-acetyltransferase